MGGTVHQVFCGHIFGLEVVEIWTQFASVRSIPRFSPDVLFNSAGGDEGFPTLALCSGMLYFTHVAGFVIDHCSDVEGPGKFTYQLVLGLNLIFTHIFTYIFIKVVIYLNS